METGVEPKSQNAVQIRGSAPSKADFIRDLYMAQDAEGLPGKGSIFGTGEQRESRRIEQFDKAITDEERASTRRESRLQY